MPQQHCIECGKLLAESAKFCWSCGSEIQSAVTKPVVAPAEPVRRKKLSYGVVAVVVAVVGLVALSVSPTALRDFVQTAVSSRSTDDRPAADASHEPSPAMVSEQNHSDADAKTDVELTTRRPSSGGYNSSIFQNWIREQRATGGPWAERFKNWNDPRRFEQEEPTGGGQFEFPACEGQSQVDCMNDEESSNPERLMRREDSVGQDGEPRRSMGTGIFGLMFNRIREWRASGDPRAARYDNWVDPLEEREETGGRGGDASQPVTESNLNFWPVHRDDVLGFSISTPPNWSVGPTRGQNVRFAAYSPDGPGSCNVVAVEESELNGLSQTQINEMVETLPIGPSAWADYAGVAESQLELFDARYTSMLGVTALVGTFEVTVENQQLRKSTAALMLSDGLMWIVNCGATDSRSDVARSRFTELESTFKKVLGSFRVFQ